MRTLIFTAIVIFLSSCKSNTTQKKEKDLTSTKTVENTMQINWTNSDEYYHSKLNEDYDKKEAVKKLIIKTLELSKTKENWNLLVLDKWIFNLGRLISNIQNEDQAIGMDRGYRVSIQFLDYYNRLESSEENQYDKNLDLISEELENLIIDVIYDESFKKQLMEYHKRNPFNIEISDQGQRTGMTIIIE